MGLMDELSNLQPNELGGTGNTFIDADTLRDGENPEVKYRIQGIDAGEVEKIIGGEYKMGTAGGQVATQTINELANKMGFTNIVHLKNPDGTPMIDNPKNGRQMIDLQDDKGRSFKNELAKASAFDINKYTTQQDIIARELAEGQRRKQQQSGDYTENEFDKAARMIQEAELEEGQFSLGMKKTAVDQAQLAQIKAQYEAAGLNPSDYFNTDQVQIQTQGQDIEGNSLDPLSDAWNLGWTSMGEAAYGFANMLGESTGWEGATEWGEEGVARAQEKMGQYGKLIMDYKDVDSFSDGWDYVTNNLAMSIPYMAATVGGAALTAATGGGAAAIALGVSAPASVYAGQIWNEQEGDNKNAAIAMTGGVLQAGFDRLGLNFIMPKGKATKEVMNAAAQQFSKQTGMPLKAAGEAIAAMSRRELAGLAGDASKIAKQQIQKGRIIKDLGKSLVGGMAGEGVTEMGQELIGWTAANHANLIDGTADVDGLTNRLVSAAVAGATLGGTFGVAGVPADKLAWADVAIRGDIADDSTASQSGIYAAEEKAKLGYVPSIQELAADASSRAEAAPGLTIDERTQFHKEAQKGKTLGDKLSQLDPMSLLKGATANIFTSELQQQSRSARVLADMFGGNLQRIYSGSNFENSKFHKVATYKNMVYDPRTFYGAFGNVSPGAKMKAEVSKSVYKTLNAAVKDGKFDPDAIPKDAKNREVLIQLGNQMNKLSDQMYTDQKKHNPELGYIDNYLFKYKSLNKKAIYNNQQKFKDALKAEFNMDDATAQQTVDNVLDNVNINDLSEATEAFSVVKGGIKPGSHQKRSLGLSEKDSFQDFMEQDVFANISQAVKSAARYTAHREFIGENGKVVSKLLDDMEAEGVPAEKVNQVAKQLQDYLDAESGNYKRAETKAGKMRERLQKNFMGVTTLAGLPLAVVSSVVEFALVHKALRADQIFGKGGSAGTSIKELADQGANAMFQLFTGDSFGTIQEAKAPKGVQHQDILRDLGFREWDVGAATVTGVTETNSWQQGMYEWFFKWNGLQGWTNTTRAMRASIAGDYMIDKAQTIANHKRSGQPMTREVQEAEEALRNLGIDTDRYAELTEKTVAGMPLTPEEETFMQNTTREATFNFVNDAVALPGAANRPLIYQDPRFALFTQFQGFMATFTANHIPKLWGEYVKRGTPAMKYSAFATMATMIMLGFLSQDLKDRIKYALTDDDEMETGNNPYLETSEYLQRGVRASGLLGTGERVLDLFLPIYEQRSNGVGDWAWNQVSGESPAVGTAERFLKGAKHLVEGEGEKGVYNILKTTPLSGPFTDLNKAAASIITGGGWDYKGDK